MEKPISKEQFTELVKDLGDLLYKLPGESSLDGLTTLAVAYAALLDIYAAPNPNNPKGMCDDKVAFRKYFASIIIGAGI